MLEMLCSLRNTSADEGLCRGASLQQSSMSLAKSAGVAGGMEGRSCMSITFLRIVKMSALPHGRPPVPSASSQKTMPIENTSEFFWQKKSLYLLPSRLQFSGAIHCGLETKRTSSSIHISTGQTWRARTFLCLIFLACSVCLSLSFSLQCQNL